MKAQGRGDHDIDMSFASIACSSMQQPSSPVCQSFRLNAGSRGYQEVVNQALANSKVQTAGATWTSTWARAPYPARQL